MPPGPLRNGNVQRNHVLRARKLVTNIRGVVDVDNRKLNLLCQLLQHCTLPQRTSGLPCNEDEANRRFSDLRE